MEICEIKTYRGRNIYSRYKVIKMTIDLKDYIDIPTNKIDGFNKRLLVFAWTYET